MKHYRKMKWGQLILAQWEGSVAWCDGVATLASGEAAPGRGMGGDNVSWAKVKLIGSKNEENPHGQFSCYKWMVKI
jgi:hypothetical protein